MIAYHRGGAPRTCEPSPRLTNAEMFVSSKTAGMKRDSIDDNAEDPSFAFLNNTTGDEFAKCRIVCKVQAHGKQRCQWQYQGKTYRLVHYLSSFDQTPYGGVMESKINRNCDKNASFVTSFAPYRINRSPSRGIVSVISRSSNVTTIVLVLCHHELHVGTVRSNWISS